VPTVTADRWRYVAIALAIVFVALNTANALNKGGDAAVFFEGGRRLLRAQPLYDGSSAADGFIGPPFQALFFSPFAALDSVSPILAKLSWYALNLWCLWIGILFTMRAWAMTREQLRAPAIPPLPVALVSMLAVLLPLQTNFEHQNMNALLLASIAVATFHLAWGSKPFAGALIGFATAIKAFPALLIVYLAARRHWTAAATAVIVTIVLTVPALAVYGTDGSRDLLAAWVRLSSSGWPIRGNNQSLIAAIDRWTGAFGASGVRTTDEAPLAAAIFAVVALVLVAGVVIVLVSAKPRAPLIQPEIVIVTVLAILLAPIAWDHYWTMMFPAFVLLYGGRTATERPGSRYAFWIAAVLTTGVVMLGRRGFDLARELSTSTLSALILYGALLQICRSRLDLPPEGGSHEV
jgi:alpha-1,2-mannosyltransferase